MTRRSSSRRTSSRAASRRTSHDADPATARRSPRTSGSSAQSPPWPSAPSATRPLGTSAHHLAQTACASAETGKKGILAAAKVLTASLIDLRKHPAAVSAGKAELAKAMDGRPYVSRSRATRCQRRTTLEPAEGTHRQHQEPIGHSSRPLQHAAPQSQPARVAQEECRGGRSSNAGGLESCEKA